MVKKTIFLILLSVACLALPSDLFAFSIFGVELVEEAPDDGGSYVRSEKDWTPAATGAGTGDGAVGAWGTPTAVTISGGVIALSGEGYYTIETEGAAASDDVTSITGLVSGDEVILAPVHSDRTVVIKTGATILIDADFTMNNTADRIGLQCIGSDTVVELGRANGGD